MIVYSGTIKSFGDDVDRGVIAEHVKEALEQRNISHGNESEYRSWEQSLLYMKNVLDVPDIPSDLHVAIEYQIPATSKRVDFIVSGIGGDEKSNVVIIELKQWEKAQRTSREDIVTTYLAGAYRAVTHPSYQAYSYAKMIEHYNESAQEKDIHLYPCCYLHNYREAFRDEIENELYQEIVQIAPVHLKKDTIKLRAFIQKHIQKTDHGKLLYLIDHGRIRPSKALQDTIVSMIRGNQEFVMIDEQKVVYSTIKRLIAMAQETNHKHTIIIEGGPGTGKSVVAINLLAEFKDLVVNYVTKNAAPRNVYFSKLRAGKFKMNYIKNLFKSSGAFVDTPKNAFDCLIVDEAHRLNEKSGLYQNSGENQIKEIINAAKVSVFFIDEDQIVTTKDFGSVNEIVRQAELLGSKVHHGEDYRLTSQFRCNGSDGYIAFLDDLLEIRTTANQDGFEMDYDLRVFDDPVLMRDTLREFNAKSNKARMIASYCYEWQSKNRPGDDVFDIELSNGFKAKWNFGHTQTWAIDEDSFEQVGCIHTSQGLEFDYVGIIIGKDLIYRDGKIITDMNERAKTDHSLKGIKTTKDYGLADRIIKNTYKTLLTRGQKGCFIYCEDKALRAYLAKRISTSSIGV